MNNPGDELGQVLGVGEHCAVEYCRQVDFLPFKCDCCNKLFCLEHRSYGSHACPKAGEKETTVIVCPLCAKSIRLERGQDANRAFEVHQRTDCDPSNYEKVHKKPRCPVAGCKEKLTTINAYRCKHCGQRVCLRHRDPGDHSCGTTPAAARQQRGARAAAPAPSTSTQPLPASGPPTASRRLTPDQSHASAVRQYQDRDNSVRGTAQRRMAQLQEQQQQQQQTQTFRWPWQQQSSQPEPQPHPQIQQAPAPAATTSIAVISSNNNNNTNANPLIPPHRPERCPQCDACFATVERLVQHVEDFHPSVTVVSSATIGSNSTQVAGVGGGGGGVENTALATFTNPLRGLLGGTIAGGEAPVGALPTEPGRGVPLPLTAGAGGGGGASQSEMFRCHLCALTFSDPVLLVQHAERCAGANRSAAAAAGGHAGGGVGGGAKDGEGCIIS